MDQYRFHQTLKGADKVDITTFEVSAGVVMAVAVQLYRIERTGLLDDVETLWCVVRAGNPSTVVLATEDEASAHRVYADEIDRARKLQSERVMYRH